MQIKDLINYLEKWAPLSYQESYDNSGLVIGDRNAHVEGAIITLDVTEEVIDESIETGCNLIIAHHPMIFSGIRSIGTRHWLDRCIRKAIKNDIHIYAIHTNLDNISSGVNNKIAEKIGLKELKVLSPKRGTLQKLTVLVPIENKTELLEALYSAGAGKIGNYDHCSFQLKGEGTFRPNEHSNPTIGKKGQDEKVNEMRIEVILSSGRRNAILTAMKQAHPYEEVAYYLSDLLNENQEIGSGMIGLFPEPLQAEAFLHHLKKSMNLATIKHTSLTDKKIERVALCGGSGRFLLERAIGAGADVFISADFKYHDYFEANNEIIIADIGHYESEVFTKELLYERLTKKFAKFAFRLSEVDTNPVKYL